MFKKKRSVSKMAVDKQLKEEALLYLEVLEKDHDEFLNESYKKFIEDNKIEFKKKVKELVKLVK
ncbi:hypothetical protein [Clostridioides difficile]|uniref:hypothetical protein n=2 Tax=Clostridioides difficile TaxID=1496 RepID=UPI001FF2800D|nr:hypothetical protein [Clostridioides difficile]